MIAISYMQMVAIISVVWIIIRVIVCAKNERFDIRREAVLLLVYVCIIVVVRFTFCPFATVNGEIQPLLFDKDKIFPMWVNFEPFVHLFEYPERRDAILNLVGNVTMFIPLGIIWPAVFKTLDTPAKAVAAGVGVTLCIEILQLPFFDRATDVDDLLLNSAGYIIGYGIYACVNRLWGYFRKKQADA